MHGILLNLGSSGGVLPSAGASLAQAQTPAGVLGLRAAVGAPRSGRGHWWGRGARSRGRSPRRVYL